MLATVHHHQPCRAVHGPRYCAAIEQRTAIRRLRPMAIHEEKRAGARHRTYRVSWKLPRLKAQNERLRTRLRWLRSLPTAIAWPAHYREWLCIHHYEGPWNDTGDPYWGGLQMDRSFMESYGGDVIRRHHGGFANTWTPLEQMTVAERAFRAGRGFGPWPNTARMCGLL